MSCAPGPPTFRLLDHLVGWDAPAGQVSGLTDPDDPGGIRLAPSGPAGPSRGDFLPWLPDPRLAPGCGRGALYLAGPQRGLLRRDLCGGGWQPAWPPDCDPGLAARPHAVAARGHLLAAATPEAVYLWRREGGQLVAVIPGPAAALALTPWGELLVASGGSADLSRYDLAGLPLGRIVTGMTGRLDALTTSLTVGDDLTGTIWALTEASGTWQLWRGDRDGRGGYQPVTPDVLKAAAVNPTTLTAVTGTGFCLTEPDPHGEPVTSCFTWEGEPEHDVFPGTIARQKTGQLLTSAIDSGQPRCRWHRVRVDADVPPRTSVVVTVATSEEGNAAPDPHDPDIWQDAGTASADFLVDRPPASICTCGCS